MKLQKILSWSFRWEIKNGGTRLWPQQPLQQKCNLPKPHMEEVVLIMIYCWGFYILIDQYHKMIGVWNTLCEKGTTQLCFIEQSVSIIWIFYCWLFLHNTCWKNYRYPILNWVKNKTWLQNRDTNKTTIMSQKLKS